MWGGVRTWRNGGLVGCGQDVLQEIGCRTTRVLFFCILELQTFDESGQNELVGWVFQIPSRSRVAQFTWQMLLSL